MIPEAACGNSFGLWEKSQGSTTCIITGETPVPQRIFQSRFAGDRSNILRLAT